MARCCACGAEVTDAQAMVLARNQSNQWITICAACRDRGVDIDALSPTPPGADPMSTSAIARDPGIAAIAADPFNAVKRLLAQLRGQRQQLLLRPHTRVHERHSVDLAIRFHLARDDVYHNAVVTDLSSGGLQIVTAQPVERGQMLHFDSQMPLPTVLLDMFQSAAEVRRVYPTADGRYAAGVRFVQRQVAKGANRRRHRRYAARLTALYMREGAGITALAEVKDLSKSGMRLRIMEPLADRETIRVILRGDTGSFARGDLVGEATALRVMERADHWEAGCEFQRTRIAPRRTPGAP